MRYNIVVGSKAWNRASIKDDRIHVNWSDEIDFDVLDYQIRNEMDQIVFQTENEDDAISWLKTNE